MKRYHGHTAPTLAVSNGQRGGASYDAGLDSHRRIMAECGRLFGHIRRPRPVAAVQLDSERDSGYRERVKAVTRALSAYADASGNRAAREAAQWSGYLAGLATEIAVSRAIARLLR